MPKLDGKLALVTGASSGIGVEIAKALAGRGARLILVARGREGLERTAAEIAAGGGEAVVLPADLSDLADTARLAAEVLAGPGAPNVLVNNAGAGRWRAIDETEPGEAAQAMTLPYLAAYELTRELVPAMIERGSGHILNMTSAAGFVTIPGANAYGVARWAMRAFSYQLTDDLRGTGVGVSLLVPSEVDSPYFDNNPGSRERIPRIARMVGTMSEAEVGAAAVRAIEQEKRELIVPWRGWLLLRTTPPPLMRALMRRTGWQREG
ncbi:MAG: SDR family NAD(P)-dependent oxidoreductase [Solirubrobacterales bacterium]